MNTWVIFILGLLWIYLYLSFGAYGPDFLWVKYLEVEPMDLRICTYLSLLSNAKLVSKVVEPIYNLISSALRVPMVPNS